jgi:drug/metabolite transporter (DMT)-like permease
VLFLSLAAIWGSSFLFVRLLLEDGIPPLTIVLYRTVLGVMFLGLLLVPVGGGLRFDLRTWRRMAILGVTNIVIPYALISWGQQYIPTAMASILNALVPIFAFLLAAVVVRDEEISPARLGGLAVGFVGVVLLALPSLGAAIEDAQAVLAVEGMLAVALAAFSYAAAAVYSRRRLTGHPLVAEPDGTFRPPTALETALGSTLVGLIVVTVPALVLERPDDGLVHLPVTAAGWVGIVWLGAFGTGLAYVLFFAILGRWGATRTTLVTYILPLVAITLGFVFLGERLRPIELAGSALVIGGVVLVNGIPRRRPLMRATGAATDLDAGP